MGSVTKLWEAPPERGEVAKVNVAKIREFRAYLHKAFAGGCEMFEPHFVPGQDSRHDPVRKFRYFVQNAKMLGELYRFETYLKTLSTVDGYLSSIDSQNPIMIYLMARYCLELIATLNYVTVKLQDVVSAPTSDWKNRGTAFLSNISRARYAISDPLLVKQSSELGFLKSHLAPINITEAIKKLALREGFSTAITDYDFFSNMCHHNGTVNKFYHESLREASELRMPDGIMIFTTTPGTAVKLKYKVPAVVGMALWHTSDTVYLASKQVDEILKCIPLSPFRDEEVSTISSGVANSVVMGLLPPASVIRNNMQKTGRNAACPCGSGRKFKLCCGG